MTLGNRKYHYTDRHGQVIHLAPEEKGPILLIKLLRWSRVHTGQILIQIKLVHTVRIRNPYYQR